MQKALKGLLVAGLAAGVALVCLVSAQDPAPAGQQVPIMLTPADIKWVDAPPALPAGAKAFVMEGDPKKPGLFAMRIKLPADYKIAPHFHDADEHVTVISGAFHVALGDVFDPSKAKELSAGSYGVVPVKTHHYAFTKAETIIQIHAIGPWVINYVNPADDPRTKK